MGLQVTKIAWKHGVHRTGKEKYCITLKDKQLCDSIHCVQKCARVQKRLDN